MDTTVETIKINGVDYVRADSLEQNIPAESLDGMEYVIVRSRSAGVHAGYLEKQKGTECVVIRARRLWYWSGAASLSQLAVDGVSDAKNCKFPCEVDRIILTEAIEILPCTKKAQLSIAGVKVWKM